MYQFNKIIDLAITLKKYNDAFRYIQLAKSRSLSERLFIDNLLPLGAPARLYDEYMRFRNIKEQLTSTLLSGNKQKLRNSFSEWLNASRSYRDMLEKLKRYDPEFVFLVADQTADSLELSDAIQRCPDETLLVDVFITSKKTILFLISSEFDAAKCVITIPEINCNTFNELFNKVIEMPQNRYETQKQLLHAFDEAYYPILSTLNELLMPKLENTIEKIRLKRIIFLPHRELHLLPLHLLIQKSGKYLCETYEVSFAPNISILINYLNRNEYKKPNHILVVENPDNSLIFATPEALSVKSIFPRTTRLIRGDATKQNVKSMIKYVDAIHFITHGNFSDCDIQKINLVLSDGELSFEEIIGNYRFRSCDFAFLSACETGKIKLDEGDEYIGMNHAFMYAGSKTVISSLWAVDDMSTMLFVYRWYHNYITNGMHKVASLREAQLWLKNAKWDEIITFIGNDEIAKKISEYRIERYQRCLPVHVALSSNIEYEKEKPFEHPFYWAPFCCYGDWS